MRSASGIRTIPGRTNVGDVQSRRRLAIIDLESGKSVWADASAFAGQERKAAPADPDVPRVLDWSMPDTSDDGAHAVIAVRSQDNKDRWYVTVDPNTGEAKWRYRMTDVTDTGVLTTASDLLITGGREGYLQILDARTGVLLWKASLGAQMVNNSITYSVNGKQYVSAIAGLTLFTFALP